MFRRCLFVSLFLLTVATEWSRAAEPNAARPGDTSFARRLWAISDLVLDHHINPPVRQQMLLDGVKNLLSKSGTSVPLGLGRKISAVTTPEQFDALVKEVAPANAKPETEAAAIASVLASVPGRARWCPPEEVQANAILESNNYVGTGIQVRRNDDAKLTQVVVAFPGGPFRRAGGRANDLIVEVDGKSMAGLKLRDVVLALRGEEGVPVTTLVRQPGSNDTRLLKMVRGVIPFQSVIGYRRTGEEDFDFRPDPALPAAYLRLARLSSSTYHELRGLEQQLRSQGNHALVLDLRGTEPGSVIHAAQVADALLDAGPMWKVRDAHGRVTEYKADRDCLFRDWPVVVLVNELTVETSAVIALALQDRGRAVLVGRPTPEGATLKSLVALPDGSGAVRLSTGIVERIKPRKVPGVAPDHVVATGAKERDALLSWASSQESPEPPAAKPPEDPQLNKALDLLRKALKENKEKTAG